MSWASWTTVGVVAGAAGAPTDEAGSLRGVLDVHTTWADGMAVVAVQHQGAGEWFTVTGSPVACGTHRQSRDLHQAVVDAVRAGDASAVLPTA